MTIRALRDRRPAYDPGRVTLHDWIDELCDALDIETELDEGLVLDLARDVAHGVERPAAPDHHVPARLRRRACTAPSPEAVEELAGRASALAEAWDGEDRAGRDLEDVEIDSDDDDRAGRRRLSRAAPPT